jgi:hypothetical protein
MVTPSTCPSCSKQASQQCSNCKDIKYCSTSCQKADWESHKLLCKSLANYQTRPTPEMRRVIVFHAHANKPTWEWMPIENRGKYGAQMEMVSFGSFYKYGRQQDCPGIHEVFLAPHLGGGNRDYNVAWVFDDSMFINYSDKETNMAVKKVCQGKWEREVGDMGMKEYNEVIAFLIQGREKPTDAVTAGDSFQLFTL